MPDVAADSAVPLPLTTPVTVVVRVIAGVEVAVATVPLRPFADTTETEVTVPDDAGGVAQVPSPRQNVVLLALVPDPRLVTGRLPETCVARPTLPHDG